ncbi:MAG: hypothetical protein JW762_15710 [Dehalococcoidales bacterium]|nr:hypothetical protein [Dehalococcoidales bacterium]
MSNTQDIDKTIIDQIIQETILKLDNYEEYTQHIKDEIKKIATPKKLTSSKKILEIIKTIEEEQ